MLSNTKWIIHGNFYLVQLWLHPKMTRTMCDLGIYSTALITANVAGKRTPFFKYHQLSWSYWVWHTKSLHEHVFAYKYLWLFFCLLNQKTLLYLKNKKKKKEVINRQVIYWRISFGHQLISFHGFMNYRKIIISLTLWITDFSHV